MNKKLILSAFILATGTCFGVMKAQNNSPKPQKAYMVADAHLDTQWNWDIQKTIKEYVWNTLSQNLFLIERYPNYIFNFEGGDKYAWMKEYYPLQYEQLKKYITAGRWHITGSSWEASDILISSPESSMRSIMLGQNFYRKEFGVEGTDIFLPDCFGFGWTLPTIAAHCGLIGFSSQKLQWRNHPFYGDNKKYPYNVGLWKGIDGSTIMMAHGYGYGDRWKDEDLSSNKELLNNLKESTVNTIYRYYGTGDIGGSPTIESVRAVEKGIKGNGPIQIISATSDQLYKDYLPYAKHPELPVYDGELLMDVHGTGCYTSKAIMKLYNRQNEQLGDAAERASVAADWLGTASYPLEALSTAWKRVIVHQFHDDLTGTSIPRAYEFSWNDELLSLKQFSNILTNAVNQVASRMDTRVKGIPVVLYNAHAYPVSDVADIELAASGKSYNYKVLDSKGKEVASQSVTDKNGKTHLLINARVPAAGYAVYDITKAGALVEKPMQQAQSIENSVYRLTLNSNGDITSLFDKKSNKELVEQGKTIRLALFTENKSYNWPAWEIRKSTIDATPISITDQVKISLVENGSLRKTLCVEKQYGDSHFRQYIRLYEGNRANRIDFFNEVDWRSTNALLKAEFPLSFANPKATYDLGIGSVERGNNTETAYEVYAQQWADLTASDGSYGVSVLNDCKYGWDKPDDHTLRLTLIHTPSTKNGFSYQNRQDFGYHTFTYSLVGHSGTLNKASVAMQAEVLNQPLYPFIASKHDGTLGKEFSFASSSNDKVAIKMLKKAEAGDEYSLRVYEMDGKETQTADITFASDIESACEADGTEKRIGDASFNGNKLHVQITPFGVRTYKVMLKKKEPVQIASMSMPLTYDKKCFSFNAMRSEANFESGYSYAAELLPDSIMTVDDIAFHFGEKDAANGMACKGNVLQLPKNNTFNRLYILVASTTGDCKATFQAGKNQTTFLVPNYTGFIGQWEHVGQNKGFLKDAEVAYVGTHRHSPSGDGAYEFTYMFKYGIDIPKGATEVTLPNDPRIVVFAATLVSEDQPAVVPAAPFYRTSLKTNNASEATAQKNNLLKQATIAGCSGYVNEKEAPALVLDGNEKTKWCDTTPNPNYLDFDLGSAKSVSGWKIVCAGAEDRSFVTRTCFLMGRNAVTEEWKTLDEIDNNHSTVVEHGFNPAQVRYLRLLVTNPTQETGNTPTRICELEVY